jgi:anthranilate/para-aminobenzoate synthase component I
MSWPSFEAAVEALWPCRQQRDDLPWAVGWLSYEACAALGGALPCHASEPGLPAGWWLLEPEPAGAGGLDRLCAPRASTQGPMSELVSVSLDAAGFRLGVIHALAQIAAGSLYQVNLTRRFELGPWSGGIEPALAAAVHGGVPPYLARLGTGAGELVCASMELLLRRSGAEVMTRPIKGTRPRGMSLEADLAMVADLVADPKERAELAMVVDLERNDLGRYAQPGSVRVVDGGSVEHYPTLHHRVARVQALVEPELPWWRLLGAMVPGGSVTGCPKRAAMDLVTRLEPVPRGPYTGVVGVVTGRGDLELALAIRTAWTWHDRLCFAAGCGIVWGSDPVREEAESRLKVQPWLDLAGTRSTP